MARHDPDRLLISGGFKHFRRTYSRREVFSGLVVLAVLAAISLWIYQRGKQRPPELYGAVPLQGKTSAKTAESPSVVPPALAEGWTESERSEFDKGNLYEKINGRADFFTSKGFERLYFVALTGADGERTIDLELYDMGSSGGALSAFTAERQPDVKVVESSTGQHYSSRNAMFLVQGKYYGRALGSDESEAVIGALGEVRAALQKALAAGERAWAYGLLVDQLGFDAGNVAFVGERAFSLEAARNVWIAVAVADGDAELFVSSHISAEAANTAAAALIAGFSSYGKAAPASGNQPVLITDEFQSTIATATTSGTFVIGVRAAPDAAWATKNLARLREAIDAMDAPTRERALAAAKSEVRPSNADESMDAGEDGGQDNEETY